MIGNDRDRHIGMMLSYLSGELETAFAGKFYVNENQIRIALGDLLQPAQFL